MNFPYFGDAKFYLEMAGTCARSIEGGDPFVGCYNGLRPIGSFAYFTLPHLLSQDPVTVLYIQVGLNVLMFLLLLWALATIPHPEILRPGGRGRRLAAAGGLLGAVALCLPFFPVALSDLPSVAVFMAGLAFLLRPAPTRIGAVGAGLLMGAACMLKQNFYVFTAMAIGLHGAVHWWRGDRQQLTRAFLACAGAAIAVLQLYWVWLHTGHFRPYDPTGIVMDEVNKVNVIEFVAYALPQQSGYFTTVDSTSLSKLSQFCIKLLQGFFAYRPAAYLGYAPAGSPVTLPLTGLLLLKAYLATLVVVAGHAWAAWVAPPRWRVVVLLGLGTILFTTWYLHVENRYFLASKLLLLWWVLGWALPVLAARLADSARQVGLLAGAPAPGAPEAAQGYVSKLAVAAYGLVLLLCFLTFQQADLLHTVGSSYAYLKGHWADFYDYNAPYAGRNDYLPSIYLVFAAWALPLQFVGAITDIATVGQVTLLRTGEVLWARMLLVGLFFATAALVCRVALHVTQSRASAWRAAAIFATSPIAVFPVFLMGQYDVVAVLLVVAGVWAYFQRRFWTFALLFALAIPYKYFAVAYFAPLLLLAPVTWKRRAQLGAVGLAFTALQFLAYWPSTTFRQNIFVLVLTKSGVGAGAVRNMPSTWLVLGACGCLLVCAACVWWRWKTDAQWHKASILACTAISAFMFMGVQWHPQWLLFATPFLALSTLYLRRPARWLAVEIVATIAFGWILANSWPGNLDAAMVQQGVFKSLFPVVYLQNADLMSAALLPAMKVVFHVCLFAPLLLLAQEAFSGDGQRLDADAWISGRFFASMAILVLPFVYCAFATEADSAAARSQALFAALPVGASVESGTRPAGELTPGRRVEQSFVSDRDGLTAVAVRFATYQRNNRGEVRLTLKDDKGVLVVTHTVPASRLRDNHFYAFKFQPLPHSAGRRYALSVQVDGAAPASAPTVWIDDKATIAGGALAIDGKPEAGTLNLRLHYAP
ncbi:MULTISPECIES: hypothetical protein [Ramlibacter]|uniref:Uncharacterized protein n=1 Tax=Ramlibacter pinisoli TaxID=2682844 RepID=A0A6N8ISG6_9BURK|nr:MULTISPECIES: hypothetical protein [Ramlibacter]MBA2964829.1 hypothetical protein [Ramlibacter sp. CGMCC 1.13660]MVQ29794.1 hypothetical protein [Ramlibacter pinisoli]